MNSTGYVGCRRLIWGVGGVLFCLALPTGAQTPWIYGYHDWEAVTDGGGALDEFTSQGRTAWITATVAVGHNPNQQGGDNFTAASNAGHTVICRINNGYGEDGTIPVPSQYANFAQRCANYVAGTQGCEYFVIGNETNLAHEWPKVNGWRSYISPQSYADCFRLCYNAIKAVRPNAKVIPQALAPFAGPYSAGPDHDGNPLGWTTYMNQMLTAIANTGPLDGIAVHINSRGYTYADVHSQQKVNGQFFSFYVYKDWVNLGTPASLQCLPYYATECNGIYYWKGGHPECSSCGNPSCCYQPNWARWIYDEINAWNQAQAATGKGIYRCVNMYRWCQWCDPWNIRGAPQQGQIEADMYNAIAQDYRWPNSCGSGPTATPTNTPSNTPTNTPSNTPTNTTAGGPANIAQGKLAYASSQYSSNEAPGKAVDGVINAGSKWTSVAQSPSWWYVDLGTTASLSQVRVHCAGAGGEPAYFNLRAFTLRASNSNAMHPGNWDTLATYNSGGSDGISVHTFNVSGGYRFVGIHITNSGIDTYARVPEVQVFGTFTATTWRIEAEDYNAFYDTTTGNSGGAYRNDHVDIEATQNDAGRFNVGWTAAGEWLDYNINVPAGSYRVFVRHAGCCAAGSIHLKIDGVNVTGSINLPATGGWQTWTTKDAGVVSITAGNHTLRIHEETANYNINYLEFVPEGAGPTNTPTNTQTPTPTNTPNNIYGQEDFESMPSWNSTFDASWGSAANWSIVSGGQSGNFLEASRSSQGSSARVRVYTVPANTNVTVSCYMRCPSFGGSYWMELAAKLGNHTAQDFDQNAGTWTMVRKFSNDGTNGNGNAWTLYSTQINTGGNTQITIGFKLGSSGGGGPTVGWDTLRVQGGGGS